LAAYAPTGYLLCYGQAVSRTTYAALFVAISMHYRGLARITLTVRRPRGWRPPRWHRTGTPLGRPEELRRTRRRPR